MVIYSCEAQPSVKSLRFQSYCSHFPRCLHNCDKRALRSLRTGAPVRDFCPLLGSWAFVAGIAIAIPRSIQSTKSPCGLVLDQSPSPTADFKQCTQETAQLAAIDSGCWQTHHHTPSYTPSSPSPLPKATRRHKQGLAINELISSHNYRRISGFHTLFPSIPSIHISL